MYYDQRKEETDILRIVMIHFLSHYEPYKLITSNGQLHSVFVMSWRRDSVENFLPSQRIPDIYSITEKAIIIERIFQ